MITNNSKHNKTQVFFSKHFPKIILENKIVSTILYIVSGLYDKLSIKIDNVTNQDI